MPSENKTENYGLNQWTGNEFVKREDFVNDNALIDAAIKEAQDKATQAFTQASNGKEAIKAAITGIDPTVTIPTDATFQQLATAIGQIETGEDTSDATAVAGDIKAPKTAYGPDGKITGTAVDNGPVSAETVNLTSHNQEYTITSGFHSGLRKIKAVITNLVSGNIRAGVTVGGVPGKSTVVDTEDAVLDPAMLVQGYSGYDDGVKKEGTLPNFNGVWQYATGVSPANGRLHIYLPTGYYNNAGGTGAYYDSPDFIEANILTGKNIFGKIGTAIAGKRFATGQFINVQGYADWTRISDGGTWLGQGYYRVSSLGLAFTPRIILYYMATTPTTNLYVCMYFRDGFTYQGRTGYCCAATYVFGCQNTPSNDYLYVGNDGTWNYIAYE